MFTISTQAVRVVWSRPRKSATPLSPEAGMLPYGLRVQALAAGVEPDVQTEDVTPGCLFEQTDYTLFVQSTSGESVQIRHRDPVLIQGLQASDDGRIVHGALNFGAQVGESRFIVEVGGRPLVSFTVEVFPSKIDYRSDYETLREEVHELEAGLVLSYLKPAYQQGGVLPEGASSVATWVALLEEKVDELEDALQYIVAYPYHEAQRTLLETRVDRVRRVDTSLLNTLRKGRGRGAWYPIQGAVAVHARLPAHRAAYTLDTPEHRWLAHQLARLQARVMQVQTLERGLRPSLRRTATLQRLGTLHRRLIRLAQHRPFRDVGSGAVPMPTLRLLRAPGYREAYQACLALKQGLHLEGGPLKLELKDLYLLYEYWCFLTLVRLVAETTGMPLPAGQLLAVEQQGLRLRLRKGRIQTVMFDRPQGGQVRLIYNPRFGGKHYVVPQQPDMMLTVIVPDDTMRRYVLDAKYRLDATPAYVRRYGLPGPPTDALNTLHRYRDAIVVPDDPSPRAVSQAVALYPYKEGMPGAYKNSRHAKLLQTVGVGALPLLPGATASLSAWLKTVLE